MNGVSFLPMFAMFPFMMIFPIIMLCIAAFIFKWVLGVNLMIKELKEQNETLRKILEELKSDKETHL